MTFTVAVAQIASLPNDPLATAETAATLRDAATHGAKLVVFPESPARRLSERGQLWCPP